MVGSRLGYNYRKPRAVSKEFYDLACPNPLRVRGEDIHEQLGVRWGSAAEITAAWAEWLASVDDRCVEIVEDSWNIYDLWCVVLLDVSQAFHIELS